MAAATPHVAFQDLDARTQRRLIMHAVVRITLGGVGLLLLYVLLPDAHRSGARAVIELLVGLCVFFGLLVWQIRQIVSATYPGLRAIEALALAGPVLVFVFSFVYLSLSRANPNQFSEPLDHVRARLLHRHRDQHGRVRRHRPAHRCGATVRHRPDGARPGADRRNRTVDRVRGEAGRASARGRTGDLGPVGKLSDGSDDGWLARELRREPPQERVDTWVAFGSLVRE